MKYFCKFCNKKIKLTEEYTTVAGYLYACKTCPYLVIEGIEPGTKKRRTALEKIFTDDQSFCFYHTYGDIVSYGEVSGFFGYKIEMDELEPEDAKKWLKILQTTKWESINSPGKFKTLISSKGYKLFYFP